MTAYFKIREMVSLFRPSIQIATWSSRIAMYLKRAASTLLELSI